MTDIPSTQATGHDLAHRREYEAALRVAGRDGPAWDDLPEPQREIVRTENRAYWQEMADFVRSLANG